MRFLAAALLLRKAQGLDEKIHEKGEQLLEEAKTAYEGARTSGSVAGFVDAGFKLEEARIKFIVLQEIGSPERQKLATDRLRALNHPPNPIPPPTAPLPAPPPPPPAPNPPNPH